MADLILITCDSGAGHLRRALPDARILTFLHRLVDGPISAAGSSPGRTTGRVITPSCAGGAARA